MEPRIDGKEIKVSKDLVQYLMAEGFRSGDRMRMDVNEAAHLARELEFVKAKTYDVVYDELKAKMFVPVDTSAHPGAETIAYDQWDEVGEAQVIGSYADDVPMVDVFKTRFTGPVVGFASGYGYSLQEIRSSQMAGSRLDQRRAQAARRAIARAIDNVIALGDVPAALPGFVNNANIGTTAPVTGTWATATFAQIQGDMEALTNAIAIQCRDNFRPDTLLLAPVSYRAIANQQVAVSGDKSMLKWILENHSTIKTIDQWQALATAGAAGATRAIAYKKSPEVLDFALPIEFEVLPPQVRNFRWVVLCHARVGGVSMYQPLACETMDGL